MAAIVIAATVGYCEGGCPWDTGNAHPRLEQQEAPDAGTGW